MTDDELKKIAEFYDEVNSAKMLKEFLQNCSSFLIKSGSRECLLSHGLRHLIREAVESYYKELKEKQKEL